MPVAFVDSLEIVQLENPSKEHLKPIIDFKQLTGLVMPHPAHSFLSKSVGTKDLGGRFQLGHTPGLLHQGKENTLGMKTLPVKLYLQQQSFEGSSCSGLSANRDVIYCKATAAY